MTRERAHLRHIIACIGRIRRYTVDGRDAFFEDEKTQDAAIRSLQAFADPCTRLSDGTRSSHPDVNWRAIRGFRTVVIHDYLSLEMERIWSVIETALDPLLEAVGQALRDVDEAQPASNNQPTEVDHHVA